MDDTPAYWRVDFAEAVMTVPYTPAAVPPFALASPLALPGADVSAGPPLPTVATCANCRAPLAGDFCATCGAPSREHRPLTVRRFVDDAWNELTNLDSASLRTFRALLQQPGELTVAYLSGRTRWFLSPIRAYLLAFALMAFAQSFTEMRKVERETARRQLAHPALISPSSALGVRTAAEIKIAGPGYAEALDRATELSHNQWLGLLDPFVLGALLLLLYRRQEKGYAEQVVMALHLVAFRSLMFAGMAASAVLVHLVLQVPLGVAVGLYVAEWIALGVYFYFAAVRVYGGSPSSRAAKASVFVVGAWITGHLLPAIVGIVMSAWFIVTHGLLGKV